MTATIYALSDPGTGEVRYIGQTVNLKERIREHRFSARNPKSVAYNNRKYHWWRSLGDREPMVEVVATVSASEADQIERDWIRTLRDFGARLTNITDGGEGWKSGSGHSDETKSKLRDSAIALGIKPPSRKGVPPWNKGLKVGKSSSTSFVKGQPAWNQGNRQTHCSGNHARAVYGYFRPDGRFAYCKACQKTRLSSALALDTEQGDSLDRR